MKRFRSSVACDASERISQNILKPHTEGLVQAVADNFDCIISSMNGLKQTHSLVMMMLQTGDENCEEQHKIKRLTTAELKNKDLPDINFVQYKGSKKPVMPKKKEALQSVLPLSIIGKAVISSNIISEFDFGFLKRIVMMLNEPEHSGFNTKKSSRKRKDAGKGHKKYVLSFD